VDQLPEPPVPLEADLRDFPWMRLHIRIQKSKQWLIFKRRPELAFYTLNLWMYAWHEAPAGSIEADDDVLADAAMCDPRKWAKLRPDLLRDWIEYRGRLYQPLVCELVRDAWAEKQAHRARTKAATEAREAKRRERDEQRSAADDQRNEQRDDGRDVHQERGRSKGKGEGKGKGDVPLKPPTTTHSARTTVPTRAKSGTHALQGETKPPTREPNRAAGETSAEPTAGEAARARVQTLVTRTAGSPTGELCKALRAGGCMDAPPSHPQLVDWIARGVSVSTINDALAIAKSKKKGQIPVRYLMPIVEELLTPVQSGTGTEGWWESYEAMIAFAREHGVEPVPNHPDLDGAPEFSMRETKWRIIETIGDGPWVDKQSVADLRHLDRYRATHDGASG
jgi:hypothetical protein